MHRLREGLAPLRHRNNPPRLSDNACEYELVSRRVKILLYFYQQSLIPLAAGNKKCHCHGWQGRGAESRYSIKALRKSQKRPELSERQRSSVRQRSGVQPWLTWIRSVPQRQAPSGEFWEIIFTVKHYHGSVKSNGAVSGLEGSVCHGPWTKAEERGGRRANRE